MSSCVFDGDNHETTFHLGIYLEDNIIGVCSFFKNKHKSITHESQYQVRGMAILKSFQGKGLGHKILSYGENLLNDKNIETIWCNAREVASDFYKKNGYQILGEPFLIQKIGVHFVMYKHL